MLNLVMSLRKFIVRFDLNRTELHTVKEFCYMNLHL